MQKKISTYNIHTFTITLLFYFIALNLPKSYSKITITLNPKESLVFVLSTKSIPRLKFNSTLQILSTSENRLLMNKTLYELEMRSLNGLLRIETLNWENFEMEVEVQMVEFNISVNDFAEIDLLKDMEVERLISLIDLRYKIVMMKEDIENFILPFNLLNVKNKKIFVEHSDYHLNATFYDYEPFLETFWNELADDKLIMTWLPFFSKCEYKWGNRIFLNDILNPWLSHDFDLTEKTKICEKQISWFWGTTLACSSKEIFTKCELEELFVENTRKEAWWHNTQQTLFYFMKHGYVSESYMEIENSQEVFEKIVDEYYHTLIPIFYEPKFKMSQENPNYFTLNFKISSISHLEDIEVLKVFLTAERRDNLSLMNGEAVLNIQVNYLNNFETLYYYGNSSAIYFGLFAFLGASALGLVFLIFYVCKVEVKVLLTNKFIFFPTLKGYIMALVVYCAFLIFFYKLSDTTKFLLISNSFDGFTSSTNQNYTNRVGMTVFLVGYFLLVIGVNQSFKIGSTDVIKLLIEDESLEKKAPSIDSENQYSDSDGEEEENGKENFTIKNMNSHKKTIFVSLFAYSFVLLFLYYSMIKLNLGTKVIVILLIYPIITKMTIIIYRHFVNKELLYLVPIVVTLQCIFDVSVIGDSNVLETLIFYLCKFVSDSLIITFLEILSEIIALRLHKYLASIPNTIESKPLFWKIVSNFEREIASIVNENRYEKSLYYSSFLCISYASMHVRPILFMLMSISLKYNFVCKDIRLNSDSIVKTYGIFLCFIPLEIMTVFASIWIYEVKLGLEIWKCFDFNKFKFSRRKIKWVSDSFGQSRCIQHFYREFEKFCFSSQLYFMMFLICFSLLTLMMGMKILLESNDFISLSDPGTLFIAFLIWTSGDILTIFTNLVADRLKFYEVKEDGKSMVKLESVEKILKKIDYWQYLEMDVVKNYFLFHCKEWIVLNLGKILDKEDFEENNYSLLLKYKHFKSQLKKKEIEKSSNTNFNHSGSGEDEQPKRRKENNKVIEFPKKEFHTYANPIIKSWLYIAKQMTFLKSLVEYLKEKERKNNCQFCSMNIGLEVIEKNEFRRIVNKYRAINVGREFQSDSFIQFYSLQQEFMTVCAECKEKKVYEGKKCINLHGIPYRLIKKWILMSRSPLLHKNKVKNISKLNF